MNRGRQIIRHWRADHNKRIDIVGTKTGPKEMKTHNTTNVKSNIGEGVWPDLELVFRCDLKATLLSIAP